MWLHYIIYKTVPRRSFLFPHIVIENYIDCIFVAMIDVRSMKSLIRLLFAQKKVA